MPDRVSRYERRRVLEDWGIVLVFAAALFAELEGVPLPWIAYTGLAWYLLAVAWAVGKRWLRKRRTP